MASTPPSDRTRVRQMSSRGAYDSETIHAILDEGFVCHLGFVEGEAPFVIPMVYGRMDDALLIHSAMKTRLARIARGGGTLCATVTLLDGLVLAKSALHHSMNYRSVVVMARAREIVDAAEKRAALDAIVEHIIPGRTAGTRPPSDAELNATAVFALPLAEASAKTRAGTAIDAEADRALPYWAGVIPLRLAVGPPTANDTVPADMALPAHVRDYRR